MPTVKLGSIGRTYTGENKFTKIEVVWDSIKQVIYDGTSKFTGEIPIGKTWEIHFYEIVSMPSQFLGWTHATTLVATNVPTQYQKQAKVDQKATSNATYDVTHAFNMGVIPSAGTSIRARLWTTEYATTQAPPQDQW